MSAYAFLTLKSSIFKNFFILWGCLVDKRFYILGFTPRGGWVLGADHPRGSCAAPSPSPRSSPCSVCRSVALSVWVWLLLLSDHAGENGRRFTPSRGAPCSFWGQNVKSISRYAVNKTIQTAPREDHHGSRGAAHLFAVLLQCRLAAVGVQVWRRGRRSCRKTPVFNVR